jgi:hypothetical protein
MPFLLQELVEESSKSSRWAAERLDAEVRQFDNLAQTEAALEKLRQPIEEFLRVSTDYVLVRMPQIESHWASGLAHLRTQPSDSSGVSTLQTFLTAFESSLSLVLTVRRARPRIAAVLGTDSDWPEKLDALDRAEKRLLELAADAKKALQHRIEERQPSDPDRLAMGLKLAREGKVLSAGEARARYDSSRG